MNAADLPSPPRAATHVLRWTEGTWELQPIDGPSDGLSCLTAPSDAPEAVLAMFMRGEWAEDVQLDRFEDGTVPGYWVTGSDF